MKENLFGDLRQKAHSVAINLRYEMAKNAPLPQSMYELWPTEAPTGPIDINTPAQVLFEHYMYMDFQEVRENPEFIAGEYDMHSHNLSVAKLGLESGAISYKKARELLYDAIESKERSEIMPIYAEWFKVIGKEAGHSMEAWGDGQTLKRVFMEELKKLKGPSRASFTASFVEVAHDFIKPEEAKAIIEGEVRNLQKTLPEAVTLARQASKRQERDTVSFLVGFMRQAAEMGYKEEIKPIATYLNNLLKFYDPAGGHVTTTRTLLMYAGEADLVPKPTRTYYKERVRRALPMFERGIGAKDDLLGGLAILNLEIGNIQTAYRLLGRIKEQTTFLHVAAHFMMAEAGNPVRIDSQFEEKYIPLVQSRWGKVPRELSATRLKREKKTWVLFKIFGGKDLAEKGNFEIFKEGQVVQGIADGAYDHGLSELAELVSIDKPQSMILELPLVVRIRRILGRNTGEDSDTSSVREAIEALIILKGKGALA